MACTLITGATYPELQSRLLGNLRCAGGADLAAPRWVVVPNATLANHLRTELARGAETAAFANARVTNLPRFAQRLCASLAHTTPASWSPRLDLLVWEVVKDIRNDSPLGPVKAIGGGPGLLRAAFVDLAEGGFGPGELEKIDQLAEEPELTARDRELLRIYGRWVQLLQQRRVAWSPLVLQELARQIEDAPDRMLAATLGAENGQQPSLHIYGFYEWIDVNLEWLSALSRRLETVVYYPWQEVEGGTHPAFSFADSVLQDLRTRFDFTSESPACGNRNESAEFLLSTFPEGDIGLQPGFLSWQRAAGVRAEAISAAVRIRTWLEDKDKPLAPEEILVVAPQAEAYAVSVQEVFAAFGIPLRVADVACGPTPESIILRMLARLWEEQAPAEWVLALLRADPGAPVAAGVNIDRFEAKVRALGIWGGSAWRAALEREDCQNEGEDKGHHKLCFDEAEKSLIQEILRFVPDGPGGPTERLPSWVALDMLRCLRDRWTTHPAPVTALIAAAEEAAHHTPSLAIEMRQWAQLVAEGDGSRMQRDPLSRAVLFCPLMRARGLTARGVIILGLAAGQVPFRVPDDPVLSEAASARLSQMASQIGHRMPVKAHLTEEMLLLFFLINTAAERVHWVVPKTDATGKAVAPTPWIQRYLHRWEDKPKGVGSPEIARAPFEQARYLAKLDLKRGAYLAPALALFLDPRLAASCDPSATQAFLWESAGKHGKDLEWSGSLLERPSFRNDRVSVTALEALARCPFRFYAEHVAGWEAMEALSLSHDLDALSRGSLLHTLLEHAVRPHLRKEQMAAIAKEVLRNDCAALWCLAQKRRELAPEAAFALALLPGPFREAALREIVELAAAYFEWDKDDPAIPQAVEEQYEKEFPGMAGLRVVGKIDRMDLNDTMIELLDFKSGKFPRAAYRNAVRLGWQIQAVLYPWLSGRDGAGFRYIFLGGANPETGDAGEAPEASRFLSELAVILERGHFIPTSNQVMEELELERATPCSYCAFVSACRRFEPGAATRHAKLFRSVAPARCDSLARAMTQRKASRDARTGPAGGTSPSQPKPKA